MREDDRRSLALWIAPGAESANSSYIGPARSDIAPFSSGPGRGLVSSGKRKDETGSRGTGDTGKSIKTNRRTATVRKPDGGIKKIKQ
jgi:hypothetical protein